MEHTEQRLPWRGGRRSIWDFGWKFAKGMHIPWPASAPTPIHQHVFIWPTETAEPWSATGQSRTELSVAWQALSLSLPSHILQYSHQLKPKWLRKGLSDPEEWKGTRVSPFFFSQHFKSSVKHYYWSKKNKESSLFISSVWPLLPVLRHCQILHRYYPVKKFCFLAGVWNKSHDGLENSEFGAES